MPAAHDALKGLEVSGENAINIGLIFCSAHTYASIGTTNRSCEGLHYFSLVGGKENATEGLACLSDQIERMYRTEEDVMSSGVALFLFLAVGSVALFSFLAVSVWTDARKKEREAYYQNETAKKLVESSGAGANAAVELLREQERIALRHKREGVKLGGLITAAVGIGVMVMIRGLEHDEPAYLAGLVPLLIGVAMLTYGYVLAPKE